MPGTYPDKQGFLQILTHFDGYDWGERFWKEGNIRLGRANQMLVLLRVMFIFRTMLADRCKVWES